MAVEGIRGQDAAKIYGYTREEKKKEIEENIICMIKWRIKWVRYVAQMAE